jgi:hypothetical protein
MKNCVTQRLFWKQWPYKIVLGDEKDSSRWEYKLYRYTKNVDADTYAWKSTFRRWFKKTFPGGGIRNEMNISVFLKTKEEVDLVIETWPKMVLELWAPESAEALVLMQDHVYDVVRENPWYNKFPIRARILWTTEFRHQGLELIKSAVSQMDPDLWHAGGQLKALLSNSTTVKIPFACGQPYYLYLFDNDDAIMLKLQAGDWVERFERQRKP